MKKGKKEFDIERFFVALSDKTRLRLLNLMGDDEVCVCFFAEILEISQPKVSRHLSYLRRAGIVETRREGKWMHYRIVPPGDQNAARVLDAVCEYLLSDHKMQHDRARLVKVCCAPALPVPLRGVPIPASLLA